MGHLRFLAGSQRESLVDLGRIELPTPWLQTAISKLPNLAGAGVLQADFAVCGIPLLRPPAHQLTHTRRNGKLTLDIVGHPRFGLPFGQDRLIPDLSDP